MAAAQNQELFPDFHNPEGLRVINDRCLVRTQDGHRVVIVSGIILAQYAVSDRMAEAHAMISLVEQGWADQNDVARVFGYAARTVRRQQQRFDEGGLAALGRKGGYPRGRARLATCRIKTGPATSSRWQLLPPDCSAHGCQCQSHPQTVASLGMERAGADTARTGVRARPNLGTQTCPLFVPSPRKLR